MARHTCEMCGSGYECPVKYCASPETYSWCPECGDKYWDSIEGIAKEGGYRPVADALMKELDEGRKPDFSEAVDAACPDRPHRKP